MYGLIETQDCRGLLTGDTCGGEHSVGLEATSSRLEAESWRRRRYLVTNFCRNLRAPPTIWLRRTSSQKCGKILKPILLRTSAKIRLSRQRPKPSRASSPIRERLRRYIGSGLSCSPLDNTVRRISNKTHLKYSFDIFDQVNLFGQSTYSLATRVSFAPWSIRTRMCGLSNACRYMSFRRKNSKSVPPMSPNCQSALIWNQFMGLVRNENDARIPAAAHCRNAERLLEYATVEASPLALLFLV